MTNWCAHLALLWAGVCLGGNIIAATAKFSAHAVSRIDLLRVGQIQFQWLSNIEWLFCTFMAILLALNLQVGSRWLIAAIAVFACQQLLVRPQLASRMELAINGIETGASNLHLLYVAMELAKILSLIVGYCLAIRASSGQFGIS